MNSICPLCSMSNCDCDPKITKDIQCIIQVYEILISKQQEDGSRNDSVVPFDYLTIDQKMDWIDEFYKLEKFFGVESTTCRKCERIFGKNIKVEKVNQ